VVALIKGGDGQNIRNIRVDNVAKLVQMGDSTHTGSVTHITDLMGNGFNCASRFNDVERDRPQPDQDQQQDVRHHHDQQRLPVRALVADPRFHEPECRRVL
jgi:hypothetical protein